MTFTVNIFLAFHNLFIMFVHMEENLKGYFKQGGFTGPQAICLGNCHPNTLIGTLFSTGVHSQPQRMPIGFTKDASLKGY